MQRTERKTQSKTAVTYDPHSLRPPLVSTRHGIEPVMRGGLAAIPRAREKRTSGSGSASAAPHLVNELLFQGAGSHPGETRERRSPHPQASHRGRMGGFGDDCAHPFKGSAGVRYPFVCVG